ncbi:MAG: hypothetical protein AB1782_06905 [Cyanobacteriota bacterium]
MVNLHTIGSMNTSFKSKENPFKNKAQQLDVKLEQDSFVNSKANPVIKKNLIGKFIGAVGGYFAAKQINQSLNNTLLKTGNVNSQKAIKILKAAVILINAVIAILTMFGASEAASKVQSFIMQSLSKPA